MEIGVTGAVGEQIEFKPLRRWEVGAALPWRISDQAFADGEKTTSSLGRPTGTAPSSSRPTRRKRHLPATPLSGKNTT